MTAQQWVSVKDATQLVNRGKTAIYRWIEAKRIRARRGVSGALEVYGPDLMSAEASSRLGRKPGSPRPAATRPSPGA